MLLSTLVSLLPSGLVAEETGKVSKVVVCTFLHWDDAPEETLYFRMGEEYHPMRFKRRARADAISLRRMDKFEIFRAVEGAANGKRSYQILASATVPSHINEAVIMVMAPEKAGNGMYRILVMDDSAEAFPASTYLFVNLTGQILSFDFAGESQDIQAGKSKVMHSRVTQQGALVPFILTDSDGKRIYENRFFGKHIARNIVFVAEPAEEGRAHRIKLWEQLLPN